MSKIAQTHLTIEWLQETVEKATKSNSKLLKWQAKDIGVSKGMTSSLLRVEMEWEKQKNLPSQVVLKIPSFNKASDPFENEETAEKMRQFMILAHNSECAAYQFLSQYDEFPIPKIYGAELFHGIESPGVIVMDYIENGAHTSVIEGFNLEQVLKLTDFLARMHAKCIQNTDWIEKFDDALRKSFEDVLLHMLDDIEKTVKPNFPDFYKKFIQPLSEKMDFREFFDYHHNTPERLGMPLVLVHGDFWSNNMMFSKDNQGKTTDQLLAVYDFQIAHAGSCTHDLSELLSLSCTFDFRQKNTETVIEYYFARLEFYLQATPPFTRDQFLSSFKVSQKRSALMAIAMMAFMPALLELHPGNKEENRNKLLDRNAKNAIDAGLPNNLD